MVEATENCHSRFVLSSNSCNLSNPINVAAMVMFESNPCEQLHALSQIYGKTYIFFNNFLIQVVWVLVWLLTDTCAVSFECVWIVTQDLLIELALGHAQDDDEKRTNIYKEMRKVTNYNDIFKQNMVEHKHSPSTSWTFNSIFNKFHYCSRFKLCTWAKRKCSLILLNSNMSNAIIQFEC